MLPLSLWNYYLLLVVFLCFHQSQTLGDYCILICTCKWKGLSGTWLGLPCPSSNRCADPLVSPLSITGLQLPLVLLLGRALHPRHYTWASPSKGCSREGICGPRPKCVPVLRPISTCRRSSSPSDEAGNGVWRGDRTNGTSQEQGMKGQAADLLMCNQISLFPCICSP